HRSYWRGRRSACLRCRQSSLLEGRQRHHRPCELVPESESGFRDRCRQNGGEASFVSAASRWVAWASTLSGRRCCFRQRGVASRVLISSFIRVRNQAVFSIPHLAPESSRDNLYTRASR